MTDNFKRYEELINLNGGLSDNNEHGNLDKYYVIELMRRGKDNPDLPAANYQRLSDKHAIMTDKERSDYVSHSWLQCIKPITNIRKGRGCDAGEWYWFEYIHDTNDGEDPNAEPFYRKLSDNDHYDEVYITDTELRENFIKKD